MLLFNTICYQLLSVNQLGVLYFIDKNTYLTACLKMSYEDDCFLNFSSKRHAVFLYNSSSSSSDWYFKSSATWRKMEFTALAFEYFSKHFSTSSGLTRRLDKSI